MELTVLYPLCVQVQLRGGALHPGGLGRHRGAGLRHGALHGAVDHIYPDSVTILLFRSLPGTRLWLSATTARAATGKVGVTNNPDHTVQGGIYIIVQGGRCTSWARPAPPAPPGTPAMTACVPACDHSQETIVNIIKEKYNRAIRPSSLYQYVSVSLGTTQSIL